MLINKIANCYEKRVSLNDVLTYPLSKPTLSISYLNPYSIMVLDDFYSDIDYFFCDGILLSSILSYFSGANIFRQSFDFTSHANDVFTFAEKHGLKVSLVGGTVAENESAQEFILSKFPRLHFNSCSHGFFSGSEELNEFIKKASFDLMVCGMGTPLQEEFIYNVKKHHPSHKLLFTCGGFITQISSKSEYWNPLLNRLNLRWLQRLFTTRFVFFRLVKYYIPFVFYVLVNSSSIKKKLS